MNWPVVRQPNLGTFDERCLIKLGVPAEAIILEPEALTTRQHMPLVKALMQAQSLQGRLAIVTSASHMPRAMMNARADHVDADAHPTDWTIPLEAQITLNRFLPRASALRESDLAIKEWIALLASY